jgi:hypothetical protein
VQTRPQPTAIPLVGNHLMHKAISGSARNKMTDNISIIMPLTKSVSNLIDPVQSILRKKRYFRQFDYCKFRDMAVHAAVHQTVGKLSYLPGFVAFLCNEAAVFFPSSKEILRHFHIAHRVATAERKLPRR